MFTRCKKSSNKSPSHRTTESQQCTERDNTCYARGVVVTTTVFVDVGNLRTACNAKDYCSPVLCLQVKQRTSPPSLVAFYDSPGRSGLQAYSLSSSLWGIITVLF